MRIFISYSSKYRDICDRLQLALEADGRHEVFVDRTQLTPGRPFDTTLRQGIEDCDLFVFLLSPESVAPGSYALAELSLAKARWRHPGGRVLPVKVAPVPKEDIPAYLRAVTILEPLGDVVAETVAAVERVKPPSRRRLVLTLIVTGMFLAAALGTVGTLSWQKQRVEQARAAAAAAAAAAQSDAQRSTRAATALQLCESGKHAMAWQAYEDIVKAHPDRPELRRARESCAMRWLREIRVRSDKTSFTEIVERVLPALAEGAASATGQHAADVEAHMGWGDYLRRRDGAGGLDPAAHYQKALALEPGNVYAHAMWGHHVLSRFGQPLDEAKQHFAFALAAGRDRAFVRKLQFAALLMAHKPAEQAEAVRALNEMRLAKEPIEEALRDRLWSLVYQDALLSRERRLPFVAGLGGTESAATFQWLFPEAGVGPERRALWRFLLASLEEADGDRASARARFEALRDELKREGASGRIVDMTFAALKRLQAP